MYRATGQPIQLGTGHLEQGGAPIGRQPQNVAEPIVAFGSFGFADDPGDSVLVVPRVVLGRRGDRAWITTVGESPLAEAPRVAPADVPPAPVGLSFADGALNGEAWMSVVADAVSRIGRGWLEKVVLARDLVATAGERVDVRWPLGRLAED